MRALCRLPRCGWGHNRRALSCCVVQHVMMKRLLILRPPCTVQAMTRAPILAVTDPSHGGSLLHRLCLAIVNYRSTTAGATMAPGSVRSWSDIAAGGRGAETDDSGTSVEVAVALGANVVLHCCRNYLLSRSLRLHLDSCRSACI